MLRVPLDLPNLRPSHEQPHKAEYQRREFTPTKVRIGNFCQPRSGQRTGADGIHIRCATAGIYTLSLRFSFPAIVGVYVRLQMLCDKNSRASGCG